MRIAVSGSNGFIGTALLGRLRGDGHDVVRLVRGERSAAGPGDVSWDPHAGRLDPRDLAGVDAVVNLAGAGIGDHRWTDEYKRTVMKSRTRSTNLLSEVVATADDGPRTLLSASAIGFYGDRGDEELDESSGVGHGFLAEVAQAWEASTAAAEAAGARVVHLRTGIVLAPHGGALRRMLPLFKVGVGGRFGSGRQWTSWITLADHVAATVHLLTSDLAGAVNLTAPAPVRNADFARALGAALRRPAVVPVPAFGPKLVLGPERAEGLLFDSQRVVRSRLSDDGFAFGDPALPAALRRLLGSE